MGDQVFAEACATTEVLKDSVFDVDIISELNLKWVKSHNFGAAYGNYYICNCEVTALQFKDERTAQLVVGVV